MIFENLQVKHKTLGLGVVTSTDGRYIKIRFENGAEKSFVYPDSFEKFLTLPNGELNDEILVDLALSNERKAKILAEKTEENIRAMKHGIVIPGKEGSIESEDEEQNYKNNLDNE